MKKALFAVGVAASHVALAFAQTNINITGVGTGQVATTNISPLTNLLAQATLLLNMAAPFLMGLAVLMFFWFLIQFILQSSNPEAKATNLKGMGLSILALFVMVSIWGIIDFFGSMVGIGQGGEMNAPKLPR